MYAPKPGHGGDALCINDVALEAPESFDERDARGSSDPSGRRMSKYPFVSCFAFSQSETPHSFLHSRRRAPIALD